MSLEKIIPIILIIIVGFAVYSNSLKGAFVWDDSILVKDNKYIKDWTKLPKLFTEDIGAGSAHKYGFYRPLQMFTYMTDYSIWKLNVVGYHLTNVILHILVALSIFWLIVILFEDVVLSFLAAILFVIHPVHAAAVSYISGRTDPLAALFMLLSFIFYIKYINSKRKSTYFFMLLSYMLALLSRENSLIFPALLLLYHYAFRKRFQIKKFIPIVAITFVYMLLRVTALKSLLPSFSYPPLLQRILGFFVAITNYLKLLLLPFDLHMVYDYKTFNFTHPIVILGVTILSSLLSYAFIKRKRDELVFFSVSWFFIAFLPVSNLYPINAYMAEHWLYLPSIGFFLILAKGLNSTYKSKEFRIFAIVFAMVLLAFYSYLTMRQNETWREPIAFYKRTLKYAPHSFRIYNNLGIAYINVGKHEEAINSFKRALEINPNDAFAYFNLGNAYKTVGKYEDAIGLYKNALKISPNDANLYNNLGNTYIAINKYEEAIASLKKAIEINPNDEKAYYNLGIVYAAIRNYGEAIELYKKVIKLNPDDADTYYNLGNAYVAIGRNEEAIALYKKALKINPNYGKAHNNLAVAYSYVKQYDLAIKHCDKALELGIKVDPKFLEVLEPFR